MEGIHDLPKFTQEQNLESLLFSLQDTMVSGTRELLVCMERSRYLGGRNTSTRKDRNGRVIPQVVLKRNT